MTKNLTTLLLTLLVSGSLWADDDILNLNCLLKGDHNFVNNNLSVRQVRYVLNRNTGTLFAQVYKDQNYNTSGWEKVDSDILESSFSADCSKVNSQRLF